MKNASNIAEAIDRSVSRNDVVVVTSGLELTDALCRIAALTRDYDYVMTDSNDVDVWGVTKAGDEFRIRLCTRWA